MKSLLFASCLFLLPGCLLKAQSGSTSDSVKIIPEYKNMYQYRNYFLSGQPSFEELQWIKLQGVKKIINLRSEKENADFTAGSFNEEIQARQMGFVYCSIPVDGMKDFTPDRLEEFSNQLTGNDTVLIHCASAGRVTHFMMAYLVKYRNYTLDEATGFGKQIAFSLPLEKLLDKKIGMEFR